MSTANETEAPPRTPYVPPVALDELRRRNAEMIADLDRWESEGDEDEQRGTMAVLREALGANRTISDRDAFKP